MKAARTPSEIFRERLQALRKKRGWKQQDVADRLSELGFPLKRVTILRTENGGRGVTLDDLLLYAAALDVSPLALLLPDDPDRQWTPLALGPAFHVDAEDVRRWVAGISPLPVFISPATPGKPTPKELRNPPIQTADGKVLSKAEHDQRVRFWQESLPLGRRHAFERPGVLRLVELADAYAYAAGDDQLQDMETYLGELAKEVELQKGALERERNEDIARRPWVRERPGQEI